jgi:group II intron reverse transcriptase/maturase
MMMKEKSKTQPITKAMVWEAFKQVRRKGGGAGVDGITIEQVAANPEKHLYPVWNRLASGSYFPKPVKRVEIPKYDGSVRPLGIPTVKDRVAQTVIANELEKEVERHFSANSFGYRPHRGAHAAVEQAKQNCWQYPWVLDVDIKGFFDNIDHALLMKALRHFTGKKHIILYVKRWLKAPVRLKDGTLQQNTEKGTPQGGVISPMLANIFLHVVFDKWMEKHYADCPFERYADDIVIHVSNEPKAREVLKALQARMAACKLELHLEKTKLVYCNRAGRRKKKKAEHEQFDFLGFTFHPRKVQTKAGKLIFGFSPSISRKAMKRIAQECSRLAFHRWTHRSITEIASSLEAKLRGWLNYFGKFQLSAMKGIFRIINGRLAKWAFNKYKRFRRRKYHSYARKWLAEIARDFQNMFAHWSYNFKP